MSESNFGFVFEVTDESRDEVLNTLKGLPETLCIQQLAPDFYCWSLKDEYNNPNNLLFAPATLTKLKDSNKIIDWERDRPL